MGDAVVRGIGRSRLISVFAAAAGPAVVVATVEAAVLVVALFGDHPRWPDMQLNLSEAAAVRDHAEVVRLLRAGENPHARRPVRPGLVGNDSVVDTTPLEAAVSIRRSELVNLLFEHGVRPSSADWTRIRCAAQALDYRDVVATLDARRPAGSESTCSGDERLW
jgi:hypothetical protein